MDRKQFFQPNGPEKPTIKESTSSEGLADWEIAREQHLSAKEEFRRAREFAH